MAPRARPVAAAAAALAGLTLLAARGGAPVAATIVNPVARQLDASDLNRAFQLTYSIKISDFLDGQVSEEEARPDPSDNDDDRCPLALTISGATEREDGVTTIPNTAIVQDGDQCEGPGEFVLIGPDVINQLDGETGTVAQVAALLRAEDANLASFVGRLFRYLVNKISDQRVKVGASTENDRECGRREVEGRTFIAAANVSEATSIGLGSGLSLGVGRYLITYTLESNPASAFDNPLCIYSGLADGVAAGGSNGGGNGSPNSGSEAVCFPAAATVELDSGATVAMADLAIGDRVRVAAGTGPAAFSEVFTFTHRKRTGLHPFVTATTASGHSLSTSPGHYVYVNGGLAPMQSVRVGDALDVAAAGVHSRVVAVATADQAGLFNPQTLAGDIVVGGVRASTYTTAVAPRLAAALLSPLRGLYRAGVTGGWLEAGGRGQLPRPLCGCCRSARAPRQARRRGRGGVRLSGAAALLGEVCLRIRVLG
eukprot:TRINITY_DN1389_c0_g2_i10.p1 TRINITY_DN1389_c0_g2~~TRINITY_DN1389_c0_g2_i10.p1  ORF type:complete len:484 (+),score=152.57 TRINITY_DN1389_c0_g2_i10:463-1914(+)